MAKRMIRLPLNVAAPTSFEKTPEKRRKVAGYARVSTDLEEQESSYEAQLDYYTDFITKNANWEFIGMYSDEGVTGTSTAKREGFNNMVSDALDGKIDLIITKSVSRFARNTVDSLETMRKLKAAGVEIYFEKENIWTLDPKNEVILTIMSSLAQEESRSISENTAWGKRKQFADGRFSIAYSRFLGYDRGEDGKMVINKEQAKIVQRIFQEFLMGYSYKAIAKHLTEDGIKTVTGKDRWWEDTIRSILMNEKYKGDALLQKGYTEDYLTKKRARNLGDKEKYQKYYVKEDHEPIIPPSVFDTVQAEIMARSGRERYSGMSIFSSKLVCGDCGCAYGRKTWHSTDRYKKIVWQCGGKYKKKGHPCKTPTLTEDEIKDAFVKAIGQLLKDKYEKLKDAEILRQIVSDTSSIENQREILEAEMEGLAKALEYDIMTNISLASDQEGYRIRRESLESQWLKKKEEIESLDDLISDKILRAGRIDAFIEELQSAKAITEFSQQAWGVMVESVKVRRDGDIEFSFIDGSKVRV